MAVIAALSEKVIGTEKSGLGYEINIDIAMSFVATHFGDIALQHLCDFFYFLKEQLQTQKAANKKVFNAFMFFFPLTIFMYYFSSFLFTFFYPSGHHH